MFKYIQSTRNLLGAAQPGCGLTGKKINLEWSLFFEYRYVKFIFIYTKMYSVFNCRYFLDHIARKLFYTYSHFDFPPYLELIHGLSKQYQRKNFGISVIFLFIKKEGGHQILMLRINKIIAGKEEQGCRPSWGQVVPGCMMRWERGLACEQQFINASVTFNFLSYLSDLMWWFPLSELH